MVKRGRGGLFAGTFGVWLLTLPARARDPWTLPMVASICLLVTQDCGVLRCFCGSCRRGDFRWLAECGRMRGRGGKVTKGGEVLTTKLMKRRKWTKELEVV